MSNAWNVTEQEYQAALELSRDGAVTPEQSAAFWQLVRFYRGQVFYRDQAALALTLIRAASRGCFLNGDHGEVNNSRKV